MAPSTSARKSRTEKPSAGSKPTGISKTSSAKKDPKKAATPTGKGSKTKKGPADSEWITICRPSFDIKHERFETEADDEEEYDTPCGNPATCICKKPADESPGHVWVFTREGYSLSDHWYDEQMKRDQDAFGMYIYNDFSGYGVMEVMENQLQQFNREMVKAKPRLMKLWAMLEGMALFLNTDMMAWGMSDDSDRKGQAVQLYGAAVNSTLELLIKHGELSPTKKGPRNLGLVLALFLRFVRQFRDLCQYENGTWTRRTVKLADENEISIVGPYEIAKKVNEIRDAESDDEDDDMSTDSELDSELSASKSNERMHDSKEKDVRNDTDWAKVMEGYIEDFGNDKGTIGGTSYDITKMSKQEQSQYSFGAGERY